MADKIIPLIYVLALGFVAFRLCNITFPESERLGNRHYALFIILNVTGFFLTAFLPASYAVYVLTAVLSIVLLTPVEPVQRIAMFLFLCCLQPGLDYDLHIGIPLLWMTWPRLLVIVILLPLLFRAFREKPAFTYPVDKYIWAFFLLNAVLAFRDTSFTNGLRGVTYLTVDMIAPYFVLSRYLKNMVDVRTVLFALLAGLVFAGCVNVFETAKHWNVFEQLTVNVNGARLMAVERLGMLRATGPFGIPSRSGFALATGLGLCWALAPYIDKRKWLMAMVAVIATGLFVTFSRGNWIAGGVIGFCYLFTANRKQFFRLIALLAIVWIPLAYFDLTDEVARVLPFIGEEDSEAAETVDYREALLDTSIRVANETPWFGSSNYHEHPDMNELRQASGLLDLVNHYVIVLLSSGYTGLLLFVAIFLRTFAALGSALGRAGNRPEEQRVLGRALFCTLVGMMVAIATTSALSRVGLFIWCIIAVSAVVQQQLAVVRSAPSRQLPETVDPRRLPARPA